MNHIERLSGPISGFVNYSLKEQYLFHVWMKRIVSVYESFGFTPLHLRPFEPIAALQGDADTQKQIFEIYRADTQKSTSLALPFDHTMPLALWIAEQAGHLQTFSFPYKRYDTGLVYRGERPKVGRFRAFIQADVDIVGRNLNHLADVECICAILGALQSLELGPLTINLNHMGIVKGILEEEKIPPSLHPAVLRSIDKLDKLKVEEVTEELCKLKDPSLTSSKIHSLIQRFQNTKPLSEDISVTQFGPQAEAGLKALQEVKSLFEIAGLDLSLFCINPGMVRGLTYYTGLVFETFLKNKEQYGSIASGGRYGQLIGQFAKGLQEIEGVGASIGVTRLFDIMCKIDTLSTERATVADILVGARTEGQLPLAYELARQLRSMGKRVDTYSGSLKVKQILKHANAIKIPHVVIVMDDHSIVLKDMLSQKQEEFTKVGAVCDFYR